LADRVPRLSVTPGSIVRAVLLVAGWLVVLAVLSRARGPIVLFALGFVAAAVVYPLVVRLRRRVPAWVAVVVVSALVALVVGIVGVRVYDEVNQQVDTFADSIDDAVTRLEQSPRYGDTVDRLDLRERADQFTQGLREDVTISGSRLTELAPTLATGAGDVFVIWLFAVMLLASGPQFVRSFVALFPSPVTQRRVSHVVRVAHARSARYLGFMFLRSAAWFAFVLGVASALDLRVPTSLALFVALLSFVPRFGVVVGALPVAVVAALRSPDLVLPVLLVAVALQALDAVLLQPRLERRSVAVGSLTMLVFVILGWAVEGTRGVLLGVAAAVFLVAVVDESLAIRDGEVPDPGADGSGAPAVSPGEMGLEASPPIGDGEPLVLVDAAGVGVELSPELEGQGLGGPDDRDGQ
jgi:predicted PurR-regulated permease PerM